VAHIAAVRNTSSPLFVARFSDHYSDAGISSSAFPLPAANAIVAAAWLVAWAVGAAWLVRRARR
jgi:hypothetical protein